MPWVYKTEVRYSPGGQKYTVQVKVWVAPSTGAGSAAAEAAEIAAAKKAARDRARAAAASKAAARAAAEAAEIAAAKKAAAAAAKARKAAARRKMWAQLNARAKAMRGELAGHKPGVAPPAGWSAGSITGRGAGGSWAKPVPGSPQFVADEKRKAEMYASQKAHWEGMKKYYEGVQRQKDFKEATAPKAKGTTASGKVLERLIKESRQNQVKSGGRDLPSEFVSNVLTAYSEHVAKVKQGLIAKGTKLSSFYVRDKNGKIVGYKKGGEAGARNLINSQSFKDLQKEWDRLQGAEGSKKPGTAEGAFTAAQQIADSQRKYTRDVAKEAFLKGQAALLKGDKADRDEAYARQKEWDEKTKWLFEASMDDIDPLKTSWVATRGEPGQPVKWRRRTVQEEFELRKGQYEAEINRARGEAENKMRLQAMSYNESRAEWGREKAAAVNKYLAPAFKALDMDAGDVSDRNKVINVVDESMRLWELDNAKYFQNARGKTGLGIVNGISGKNIQAWSKAKEAQKKKFYDALHAEGFGLLDVGTRAMNFGPVKAFTDTIAGVGGSILTGGRILLKSTTGSSQLYIGRDKLPPHVLHDAYAAQKAARGTGGLGEVFGRLAQASETSMEGYIQKWLATPEGKAFTAKEFEKRRVVTQEQDWAAAQGLYGEGGDIWTRLNTMAEYGGNITSDPGINLFLQLAVDPTIALPLKFTTWPQRLQHAINAARGVGRVTIGGVEQVGTGALNRVFKAAAEFQRVDESTLRFQKGLAKFKVGPDMAQDMLAELAGMKAKNATTKQIEKKFRDWGIDPRSTDGKLLMNDATRAIVAKLEAKGVNYIDAAKEVQKWEADRVAEEALARAAKSPGLEAADEAVALAETAAREAAEKSRTSLTTERLASVETQLAKVEEDLLARETAEQLAREAKEPHKAGVAGDADGAFFASQASDPLRQAAREVNAYGGVASTDDTVRRISPAQDSADLLQSVTGHTDTITDHGVEFAATKATFDLRATPEYQELIGILDTWAHQNGRVVRTGAPDEAKFGRISAARARDAQQKLANMGRESQYARLRENQNVGRSNPLDPEGKIPWRESKDGVSYQVAGGRKSSQQHISTYSESASLAGLVGPTEEIAGKQFAEAMEKVRRAAVTIYAKHKKAGTLGSKEFEAEMEKHVRRVGVQRTNASLSVDLRSQNGALIYSQLDHFLASDYPGWLPIGDILYEDLMRTGTINQYYEVLSLLPEMMKGVGYETGLMADIMNPFYRASLDRRGFAAMLRRRMFLEPHPGPVEFRQGMAHLFALFHLTKLDAEAAFARIAKHETDLRAGRIDDVEFRTKVEAELATEGGSMQLLYDYSKTMQRILDGDPNNVYARAWQVMEARAGVWWSLDPVTGLARHTEVEQAFIWATLAKDATGEIAGRLHPNLALAMIPAGPIARSAPITHGFTGYLKSAATSTSRLFRISPARWTDKHVTDSLTKMFSKNMSADDAVILANQISHYMASRYGITSRRAQFRAQLFDFSIESVFRSKNLSPEATAQFKVMRQRYIELNRERYGLGSAGGNEWVEGASLSRYDKAAEVLGKEFDDAFSTALGPGKKRREFNKTMRALFEESYWRGEVTHGNVGLHTSMFLTKMADPTIQRGDTWVRYANSYFDHMVAAGAGDQAREVIKELFVGRIAQTNGMTYDAVKGLGAAHRMHPGKWYGSVREFFVKIDVLGDMERAIAEGEARTPRDLGFAEEQAALEALHDDFLLADEAARTLADDPDSAMYAMADIEHVVEDGVKYRDDGMAAVKDLDALEHGESSFRVAMQTRDDALLALEAAEARMYAWQQSLSPFDRARGFEKPAYVVAAEKAFDEAEDALRKAAKRYQEEDSAIEALATAEKELADARAKPIKRNRKGEVSPGQELDLAVANEKVRKAQAKVDRMLARPDSPRRLAVGPRTRPSKARMDIYHKNFRRITSGREKFLPASIKKTLPEGTPAQRALAYLQSLPDDARPWVTSEIRLKNAQDGMRRALNSIVHRTIEMGSIPVHIGDDMQSLVDNIKVLPGGSRFLQEWAQEYYTDLLNSRLIDYLQHEDWFKFKEVAGDTEVIDLTKQIGKARNDAAKLRDKVAKGEIEERGMPVKFSDEEKATMTAEAERLDAKAVELEGTRKATIEGRVEGGIPVAPDGMPQEIRAPDPSELNHSRVRSSTEGLAILHANTEEEWLARELQKAKEIRREARGSANGERRAQAHRRVQDIERAFKVIEVAKSNGKATYTTPKSEKAYVKKVLATVGERAKDSVAPRLISAFLVNAAGAEVEQGRSLLRLLRNSSEDGGIESAVRRPGEVSDNYAKHGEAIEAKFGQVIPRSTMNKHGLHVNADITGTELLTNLDEFADVMRNEQFSNLVNEVVDRANNSLRTMTGDPNYGIEQWLDDRLVHARDGYLDSRLFEEADRRIVASKEAITEGAKRQTRTDLRRKPGELPENPVSEMFEVDVQVVTAKAKVLAEMGIDPHAYNEARRVLRPSFLKKKYGLQIARYAKSEAEMALRRAGVREFDPDYAKKFQQAYDEAFLAKRADMAGEESQKLLEQLAKEMLGATNAEVIAEFERRYGLDNVVKGMESKITPFQRRTLEEAVKTHLGVDDLNDPAKMMEALSRHGQAPPFHNRAAMREWLVKYGFWSPRTAQMVEDGKKSWSIQEEAKFYNESWGRVPDWANPELLDVGGPLRHILFDTNARAEQYRDWGLFNRNMEARFATGNMGRVERARFLVEGSLALGLNPKRDLPMERKYVIERYGELVSPDGETLTAFPELMTRDELKTYISKATKDNPLPEGMVQDLEELQVLHDLMDLHVDRLTDRYLAGETVTYADVYAMSAQLTSEMLMDPIWLKRSRDHIGGFLRGQAAFRRSLVFTQIPFLMNNVVDTFIKGPWTAFVTRSFHNYEVSAYAKNLTLLDFGFQPSGQLLRDVPVHGTERWKMVNSRTRYYLRDGKVVKETAKQKRMADAVQRALAVTEIPAQGAGMAEDFAKLRLAQQMYDKAKDMGLAKGLSDEEADAYAKLFARDEVSRMWPTVGDGPIEGLFNQISPFMSYQFKNHAVFIGEFFSHPALFNYFDNIGDYIEQQNLEEWAKTHPETEPMPENLRRLIQIPWAKDLFIDLGQFSDAAHGLKPLFEQIDQKATVGSLAGQFVRLAGANDINLVLGILNAMDWGQTEQWQQTFDENGFGNGDWTKKKVPWEAPWGGKANWLNSFWPVEVAHDIQKTLEGKLTPSAITKLAYQTAFFGNLKQYDRGAGLNSFYWTLREQDAAKAEAWLDDSPEGKALRMWWLDKAAADPTPGQAAYTAQDLRDILKPPSADRNKWLHMQTKEYQKKVTDGFEDLNNIRAKWDNILWKLTPGTKEFRDARLRKNLERYEYYKSHPWMYDYEAMTMTPEEWAKKLDEWKVDDLVDTFFGMTAPESKDYKSAVEWQKAVKLWKEQRVQFLSDFPQVTERLARTQTTVEAIWKETEQGWFDTLDRIGTRKVAIEAAKQAKDYDLLDQLYLANELDYDQLNEDLAVQYFDPTTDFNTIPGGAPGKPMLGPQTLKSDPFGNQYIERTKILPDFNKWRYSRMNMEEKAKFERDQKYASGMKGIIAKAKASGNFGKTFVEELKKNPWLMEQYFKNNPGKREKWASNDDYFRLISRFGILMKQGRFDEGNSYFDNLPNWVKARYYAKHPERRQKAKQGLEYMNWMKRWTAHYKKRDYEGGAAFFEKMPKWVKDRYYAKHPSGFGRGSGGSSPYAKAMGKWVKLLQENKDAEAKAYFDSMPQAFRDRYYAKHPDQQLRDDVKRSGQLGAYFAADDANRAQYLKDNPEFAKWLKKQGGSKATQRMLIMAGYQALPKGSDGNWLRRVYREQYPEVFSKEAAGVRSIQKVARFLAEHPDMTPAFEKWLKAVMDSYQEELKHTKTIPTKMIVSDHSRQRRPRTRVTPHHGQSAAWVRLHQVA